GMYAAGLKGDLPGSPYVDSFYRTVEELPAGSVVLLSADFDPASAAELLPMYTAVIHHLFSRELRIVNVATWPAAPPYTSQEFARIAPRYEAVYGEDWVELGFKPGDDVAMGIIAQSLENAYPTEARDKRPYDEVPLLRDVGEGLSGVSLLVTMSAGYPGILEWIAQVGGRYDVPIVCGTTAVQTPDIFAFYPRQVRGFLGAATGATQYLQLVAQVVPDEGVRETMETNQGRMLVQSWAHVLIIGLIVLGNAIYFSGRGAKA
ncbi:MAG TPA: hypothetical protein VFD43_07385, partial [Planctomycetota bacterium]|nr:hypothetical protein [Planctomycetota bacterium]